MKKILIIGTNSYIGKSFINWIEKFKNKYIVESISVRDNNWQKMSFKNFDVLYHLAAIVHFEKSTEEDYYKINRDLAFSIAKKAKQEGVKHFIFVSTMGVYGRAIGVINRDSKINPKTPYAKSKFEAEQLLNSLKSDNFIITILRPPIVYGKGCKGNYQRLSNFAKKTPIFPKMKNKRSMIFIDNLSECVRKIIDFKIKGIIYPQNDEYVNTTNMIQLIAKYNNKKILTTRIFNPMINILIKVSSTFAKIFGTFIYSINDETKKHQEFEYQTCSFEESIKQTEL